MSLQHLTMNEVEAEIKSLKVNGIPVIPQFGIFPFKGNFGVQGTRYLSSYAGTGSTNNEFTNGIQIFRPTKISMIIARKSNDSPTTVFQLFKSDINFANFTNIDTITIIAGLKLSVKIIDYTLQTGDILLVSTTSSGAGNPQDVSVFIESQNA